MMEMELCGENWLHVKHLKLKKIRVSENKYCFSKALEIWLEIVP